MKSKILKKVKEIITKETSVPAYIPSKEEKETQEFVQKRVTKMQDYRKSCLSGKDIELIWKEADKEYEPKYNQNYGRKVFASDDELGLRSRQIPVGETRDAWKSHNSDPTLFVKIQTAMSIIIDKDPEAFFQATTKKYDATTKIAHALWKSSWAMDNSKQQLKLFSYNLAKYGWAAGRTYPRIIKRSKKILTEIDTENSENNKYEERMITEFNGIHRENLDPFRTWIDEMTRPNDQYSTNDWYFEKDYDYDTASLEFGNYANWQFVNRGDCQQIEGDNSDRKDIVTIGFYENKNKDLYVIYVPSKKLVLGYSPLPNDDGRLSVWHTYWSLRNSNCPLGIGIWEIIKQKKGLYDKMMNMTMDQLVLSIYKMFFYTGTNALIGSGEVKIEPGKGVQNLGGKVDFLEVPGPGEDAYKGLSVVKGGIDEDTGITPTLEGELSSNKTLGEILHAKEAALRRMNIPLNNIAEAVQAEAFISLSWISQTLSTPEVKTFINEADLVRYEQEAQNNNWQIKQNFDETGNPTTIEAAYLPSVPLNIEKKEGILFESKKARFFQIGQDIMPEELKWEGIITVVPRSILTPSLELEKQRKLQMFNVVVPLLQFPMELYAKAIKQIIKVNEEDVEDWLPDQWVQYLETGKLPSNPMANPLFTNLLAPENGETMKGQAGLQLKQAQTVVPLDQTGATDKKKLAGGAMDTFLRTPR